MPITRSTRGDAGTATTARAIRSKGAVLAGKPASGRHRAGRALELTWMWLAFDSEDTRAARFQGPAACTRAAGVTVQRRHHINARCAFLLERGIAIPRGWRASHAELPQRTHHDREADTVPDASLLLVPNPDSSTAATAPSFDHLMRSTMGAARG